MEKKIRAFKAKVRDYIKLGRNDLCLCGSEKKYKHCCKLKGLVFVNKQTNDL